MSDVAALTEIVRGRLSWASLHWFPVRSRGGIKSPTIAPEIAPEIAKAIVASDWLADRVAEAVERERAAWAEESAAVDRIEIRLLGEACDRLQARAESAEQALATLREDMAQEIESAHASWQAVGDGPLETPLHSTAWFVERSYADAARIARGGTR